MDFRNRKKVEDLKRKIDSQCKDIAYLKSCVEEYEKKRNGNRVVGGYCAICEHSIKTSTPYMGGAYETFCCELDCHCKDFQKKHANDCKGQT